MGPEFHRFSDLLSSLLSYIFPWIFVFSTACFLASVFLISFVVVLHHHRPVQAFPCCFASLGGLHVEHFKDGTASRLWGGHTQFVYCFFLSFWTAVHTERAWHATRPCLHAVLVYPDWH
jgi:hypothetical protein